MKVPWVSLGALSLLLLLATALLGMEYAGLAARPDTVALTRHRGVLPTPSVLPPHASMPAPGRAGSDLIVPVEGVARRALTDTWGQARAEGRSHEGIDIMAASGAPVLAAGDGQVVKFFDSVRGGITIYQTDRSGRFIYYYAHLSSRAPGLLEGAPVRQGQVIGYVGMTGNAPVPHLHFEVQRLGPQRHWWQAEAMNPYPLLVSGRAPI